jgi:hypothetical protein
MVHSYGHRGHSPSVGPPTHVLEGNGWQPRRERMATWRATLEGGSLVGTTQRSQRGIASPAQALQRLRDCHLGFAARAVRRGGMLWRDLRAAIKTEMAARLQVMKQSDRAKGNERAVALMVSGSSQPRIRADGSARRHNGRAGARAFATSPTATLSVTCQRTI